MRDEDELKRFLSPKSSAYINRLDEDENLDPNYAKWDEDEENDDEVVHYIEPGSEEEKEAIKAAKMTTRGMYVSFIAVSICVLALGLLLFEKKITFSIGVLTGLLTGFFYIHHLNSSVREVLNYDNESAVRSMKKDATIRIAVVGIVGMVVAGLAGGHAYAGVLMQIFSLKISAYLTPSVAEFLMKMSSKSKK